MGVGADGRQIGLLEPKYLPSGEQQENKLRAVRFPTHVPAKPKGDAAGVTESVRAARSRRQGVPMADTAEGKTGGSVAGTTSAQDPNAA